MLSIILSVVCLLVSNALLDDSSIFCGLLYFILVQNYLFLRYSVFTFLAIIRYDYLILVVYISQMGVLEKDKENPSLFPFVHVSILIFMLKELSEKKII